MANAKRDFIDMEWKKTVELSKSFAFCSTKKKRKKNTEKRENLRIFL